MPSLWQNGSCPHKAHVYRKLQPIYVLIALITPGTLSNHAGAYELSQGLWAHKAHDLPTDNNSMPILERAVASHFQNLCEGMFVKSDKTLRRNALEGCHCLSIHFNCCWKYSSQEKPAKILITQLWLPSYTDIYVIDNMAVTWCALIDIGLMHIMWHPYPWGESKTLQVWFWKLSMPYQWSALLPGVWLPLVVNLVLYVCVIFVVLVLLSAAHAENGCITTYEPSHGWIPHRMAEVFDSFLYT